MFESPELVGALFAVGAASMTAIMALFLRVGTDEGGAFDALVIVLFCNLLLLSPAALIWHYPEYGVTTRSLLAFALAGLVGTMIGRAFYYGSIERIGASRSDAIKASQPLHATLIALFILGETFTLTHLFGILLIMFGVAAVSWETTSGQPSDVPRKTLLIGLLFPLAAAFFYGIEPTFARIGFAEGTPVLVGLMIKTIAATIGFLLYLRWRGSLPTLDTYRDANLKWYLAAGIANTAFLAFYYGALELARVNIVIPMVQTSPFFVLVLSYFLLPNLERITLKLAAAASCVVIGAIIVVMFV